MTEEPKTRLDWFRMLPQGSVGAEIGVDIGRMSWRIAKIVQPRLLWLVDAWDPYVVYDMGNGERMLGAMNAALYKVRTWCARGQVRVLCAHSLFAATFIPDASLDWVYIDAGHTYQECLTDLRAWGPKVRPGGLIAGHDHTRIDPGWGVIEAVAEFRKETGMPQLHLTEERYHSYWMRKPEHEV